MTKKHLRDSADQMRSLIDPALANVLSSEVAFAIFVEQTLAVLDRKLDLILRRIDKMATAADIKALADRLGVDLRRLSDDVRALQAKPGGISPSDLDPAAAEMAAAADAFEALAASA